MAGFIHLQRRGSAESGKKTAIHPVEIQYDSKNRGRAVNLGSILPALPKKT